MLNAASARFIFARLSATTASTPPTGSSAAAPKATPASNRFVAGPAAATQKALRAERGPPNGEVRLLKSASTGLPAPKRIGKGSTRLEIARDNAGTITVLTASMWTNGFKLWDPACSAV